MFRYLAPVLVLLAWLPPGPLAADVLLIQNVVEAPPNSASGLPRPTRGMSMQEVESIFGSPVERKRPVGEPPITRWVYDGFSVIFESRSVLHSVVHRPEP